MSKLEKFYLEEADFLLRENMNRLKGMIDLLYYGALEDMTPEETEEFLGKLKTSADNLFGTLEESIAGKSESE